MNIDNTLISLCVVEQEVKQTGSFGYVIWAVKTLLCANNT